MDRFVIVENPHYSQLRRQFRWLVLDNYGGTVHAKLHSFTDAVVLICGLAGYAVLAQ